MTAMGQLYTASSGAAGTIEDWTQAGHGTVKRRLALYTTELGTPGYEKVEQRIGCCKKVYLHEALQAERGNRKRKPRQSSRKCWRRGGT